MIRIFLILFSISLSPFFSSAQSPIKYQTGDYNQDGKLDSLGIEASYGSVGGQTSYVIINGKTGFRDTIIRGGCNCEMINLTAIPDWLMETKNEGFRKAIENHWQTKNTHPDFSLQWLLDAHFNPETEPKNSPFKRIINSSTNWHGREIGFPYTRSRIISGDTLKKLAAILYPTEFAEDNYHDWENTRNAWLIYYGNHHKKYFHRKLGDTKFELVDSNKIYSLYKTLHGIIVKKDDQYKWVLVNSSELTGTPFRPKTASIQKVKLVGSLVVIHNVSPPWGTPQILIADINTGKIGILTLEEELENPELLKLDFNIKDETLNVHLSINGYEDDSQSEKTFTFNLKKLQKALNQ